MFISRTSSTKEDTFDQCTLKYKLRYIDKLPEDPNSDKGAMNFGSFIHKIFEEGVNAKTYNELYDIAKKYKKDYKFNKSYEPKIEICIKNFLKFNATLQKTIGTELNLLVECPGDYSLNGIIDRVIIGRDKGILVIDYKTGKTEKNKFDLYQDNQLKKYVYLVHKQYNTPIKNITASHYYPVTNTFVPIKYTQQQINAILAIGEKRVWKIRKMKKTEFQAQKNKFCNWCAYQKYCPLFTNIETIKQNIRESTESKK